MFEGISHFGGKEAIKIVCGTLIENISKKFPGTLSIFLKYNLFKSAIERSIKYKNFLKITAAPDNDISGYQVILRSNNSDIKVYQQVLLNKEYRSLADYVVKFIGSKKVKFIIDAGANIGLTSLYLKKRFPNASIISVEPSKSNAYLFKRNIKGNKLNNIYLLEKALWSSNEDLEIDKSFRDGLAWSISVKPKEYLTESEKIKGITIERIFTEYKLPYVDILKIDIEGAERIIFKDDEQVNNFLSKTKFIAIEIHDEFNIRDNILQKLTNNGFFYFQSGELTIGVNKYFYKVPNG